MLKVGAGLVIAVVVVALLGPWVMPFDPARQELSQRLIGPSLAHAFGFDELGRDVLSRVVAGAQISLVVAFTAVVVQSTLGMAGAIIGEASLSFLGLGVQPPTPSWGTMLSGGRAHIFDAPHLTIFPGLAIALLVLGFNFLGDGLRDALDPKRRG